MLRFSQSTHRIMVDPVSLMIQELNDIYYGTEDKGHATDVLSYIHLVSQIDPEAPYFASRKDEVVELAARDIWGTDYRTRIDPSVFDDSIVAYLTAFDKPEVRIMRVFNHKIDQLQTMLEGTTPIIEKSTNQKAGTFTYVSNTKFITQVMSDLTDLMDGRDALQARIQQTQQKENKIWGGRRQSFLDKKRLKDAIRKDRTRATNENPETTLRQTPAETRVSPEVNKSVNAEEAPAARHEGTPSENGADQGRVRPRI